MPYGESTSDLVSKDRDQAVISFIEDNLPNVETIEDNEVYLLDVNPMLLNYFEDNDIQIDCKYQAYQSWQSQVNDEVEKGVLEYLETYQPKYVVAKISEEDTSSNEELDISPLSYLTYISSHYTVIAKEENCSLAIYQIN
jgi:hypothetical protein